MEHEGPEDVEEENQYGHLVSVCRDGHQGGAKTNGYVVGVHHVLVTGGEQGARSKGVTPLEWDQVNLEVGGVVYLEPERWLRKAKRYLITTKIGLGQDFTRSRTFSTNSCFDSSSREGGDEWDIATCLVKHIWTILS